MIRFSSFALALLLASFGFGSPERAPRGTSDRDQASTPAPAETEAERKLRKTKEYLEANGTREAQERALDKLLEGFAKMGLPDEFAARFKDRFDIDEILDKTAEIYAEHLDEPTLDGLVIFAKSEAGKALAKALPDINDASLAWGMEYGARIGREVTEELGGK